MLYSVSYTHFLRRGDVIHCIFGSKPKASSMARLRNGGVRIAVSPFSPIKKSLQKLFLPNTCNYLIINNYALALQNLLFLIAKA